MGEKVIAAKCQETDVAGNTIVKMDCATGYITKIQDHFDKYKCTECKAINPISFGGVAAGVPQPDAPPTYDELKAELEEANKTIQDLKVDLDYFKSIISKVKKGYDDFEFPMNTQLDYINF